MGGCTLSAGAHQGVRSFAGLVEETRGVDGLGASKLAEGHVMRRLTVVIDLSNSPTWCTSYFLSALTTRPSLASVQKSALFAQFTSRAFRINARAGYKRERYAVYPGSLSLDQKVMTMTIPHPMRRSLAIMKARKEAESMD